MCIMYYEPLLNNRIQIHLDDNIIIDEDLEYKISTTCKGLGGRLVSRNCQYLDSIVVKLPDSDTIKSIMRLLS